ncbi:hypothetical protein FRUB_07449 [Fimbriiglobus ruber]|uniref:POTRA domain-containing protein n=2 Tax=Fimbriiglobus ruber TaxID=1908690 RepID=A0A225DM92_9BACT|nr:hypothetical protein FRUB_07449 [Fimbriiglobus ruber]
MLDEFEALRAQKAELEKKEIELTKAIRTLMGKQVERISRLGIVPAVSAAPDRVGRIVITGNAGKDEKKILDAVKLTPGQSLAHPALEDARTRLTKAGYRKATVEVRPGETGYVDLEVKIGEE